MWGEVAAIAPKKMTKHPPSPQLRRGRRMTKLEGTIKIRIMKQTKSLHGEFWFSSLFRHSEFVIPKRHEGP
jgi:hypothetical protein